MIKVTCNDVEENDSKNIHDLKNIILNCIFGRISIKKLMRLMSPKRGEEKYKLLYYKKLNTFFYYDDLEHCYYITYYSTKVFDINTLRTMHESSIEVPQTSYFATTDDQKYANAINFCRDNNLEYHDDTDVFDFWDEKRKLFPSKETEVFKFKSIDEIINYLKYEYKGAVEEFPDPSFYIDNKNNRIINYMSYLSYDDRDYCISSFLDDNDYTYKEFDKDKFWDFFKNAKTNDEIYDTKKNESNVYVLPYTKFKYEILNKEQITFIICRALQDDRFDEGTYEEFISTGCMLRAIERLKELKETE